MIDLGVVCLRERERRGGGEGEDGGGGEDERLREQEEGVPEGGRVIRPVGMHACGEYVAKNGKTDGYEGRVKPPPLRAERMGRTRAV